MPTARNARGVDIIAYSRDATRFHGVQVKALSKRHPVPLGTSLDKIMGDFWVIVNKVASAPSAFILLPSEVKERAHRGEKEAIATMSDASLREFLIGEVLSFMRYASLWKAGFSSR